MRVGRLGVGLLLGGLLGGLLLLLLLLLHLHLLLLLLLRGKGPRVERGLKRLVV